LTQEVRTGRIFRIFSSGATAWELLRRRGSRQAATTDSLPETLPPVLARSQNRDLGSELDPIVDANTVKDVEYGRNTELATLESIAKALGFKLELVEA
jgi:hypothetical protein